MSRSRVLARKVDPSARLRRMRLARPMSVRCALCDWTREGPTNDVLPAQKAHAAEAHGITDAQRNDMRRVRDGKPKADKAQELAERAAAREADKAAKRAAREAENQQRRQKRGVTAREAEERRRITAEERAAKRAVWEKREAEIAADALRLQDVEGLNHRQTAERLGLTMAQVRRLVALGRARAG